MANPKWICATCDDLGFDCQPKANPPVITCPGEGCAACDYAAPEGHDDPVRSPECQCLNTEPHGPHEWSSLSHRWSCDGRTS